MEVSRETLRTVENIHPIASESPALQPRILLIGRDAPLLSSRAAVLQQAGYTVQISTPGEARNVLQNESFGVVILGHTMAIEQIVEIGSLIRERHPRPRTLMILGPDPLPVDAPRFDATIVGLDGPPAMIQAVCQLMGK